MHKWALPATGNGRKRHRPEPAPFFSVAKPKERCFEPFSGPVRKRPSASAKRTSDLATGPSARGVLVATTVGRSTQDKSPVGPEPERRLRFAVTIRWLAKTLSTFQGEESGRGGC